MTDFSQETAECVQTSFQPIGSSVLNPTGIQQDSKLPAIFPNKTVIHILFMSSYRLISQRIANLPADFFAPKPPLGCQFLDSSHQQIHHES